MHYSGASQGSARRRVNGQISSYFHELIVLSRKRSDPSLKYLFYESAYNFYIDRMALQHCCGQFSVHLHNHAVRHLIFREMCDLKIMTNGRP